jgi:biopolymer transport protein TolR
MAFSSGSKGVKNEINVTPLVDVVLVLLIIFMVVTPMLQRGKDVHLPKASKADEENKQMEPLIVSMTNDKTTWLENNVCDDACIEKSIGAEVAKEPNKKVVLKGDEKLTIGDVRRVMAKIKTAGARGVALGVEELKK